MLDELAWTQQLPAVAHLLGRDDIPRKERHLPFRPRGRVMLIRRLRAALQDVAAAAAITARIVPHQFRHTYGTEMLRAGVGFAGVMQLLGHKSPHMTLEYLEITQPDLQREFLLARSHPRHLAPSRILSSASPPRADLAGLMVSLETAQHVLEMFRRSLPEDSPRRLLARLARRLVKILADARKLNPPQK
jgi:hypothetical protein